MMTDYESYVYDMMIEYGVATEAELGLARCLVAGSWTEVLDAVCYVRTGYRTWAQFTECELEEEEL